MVCQYVHTKWRWWWCFCWLNCTEIEQESESGSCARAFELYITDEFHSYTAHAHKYTITQSIFTEPTGHIVNPLHTTCP